MEKSETSNELLLAPIHELSRRIAEGSLSSSELTAACLEHIEQSDGKLHAFKEVYRDEAIAMAEAADTAITKGFRLGPLHGIPIALKDLCELEGRCTSGGTLVWKDRLSPLTCTVAKRLMGAGMIVVGKTHMVEFAFGGWGTNARMGTPWNPWDLATHRVPGGSSSGSGVAVGAGMVPGAIGSDTGGSVRIPASLCGLVGLKTTFGRISNHGILPLSRSLDSIGPMTRSVEDAALLFDALHGPDPADPDTLAAPPVATLAQLRESPAGLRVGVPGKAHLEGVDPEVRAAFDAAVSTLEGLGVRMDEIEIPGSFFSTVEQTGIIISAEAYEALRDVIETPDGPFDPNVLPRVLGGKAHGARAYINALREQEQARAGLARLFEGVQAILTPTTPITALPLTEVDETQVPLSRYTRAVNFLGLCALAVPSGITADGLPTSIQIIGKPFAEALVLRLGWAFEQARGGLSRLPDLAAMKRGA